MADSIHVEVAYAEAAKQIIVEVMVPRACTILQAIETSGVLNEFPSIGLENGQVGIFGEKKSLHTVVKENDRIEIYRPLLVTAKEARRKRAAAKAKARPTGKH
ncbi:RnfH family protein [Pseudomonadota bacterium]